MKNLAYKQTEKSLTKDKIITATEYNCICCDIKRIPQRIVVEPAKAKTHCSQIYQIGFSKIRIFDENECP